MTALEKTIKTHLNLSILQEFRISGLREHFRFSEEGLQIYRKNNGIYAWWLVSKETAVGKLGILGIMKDYQPISLEALLIHPEWILPITYKPSNDQIYYCWGDNHQLYEYPWSGSIEDLEHYATGNCFHSKEEAEEQLTSLESRLTSTYYTEKDK